MDCSDRSVGDDRSDAMTDLMSFPGPTWTSACAYFCLIIAQYAAYHGLVWCKIFSQDLEATLPPGKSVRHFCLFSLSLFPTPEARILVAVEEDWLIHRGARKGSLRTYIWRHWLKQQHSITTNICGIASIIRLQKLLPINIVFNYSIYMTNGLYPITPFIFSPKLH